MKIITSDSVAVDHADCVFRHSSARDGLAVITTLLAAAAVSGAAWVGALPVPVAVFALVFIVLFGVVALRTYRRTKSTENWLLAINGSRVQVKLRSHLNADTAKDAARVVELEASDLVGLRVTQLATGGHSASGEPENARSSFLELLLRDDSIELADAVRAERERRAPGAVWRHYPVTLPDARTLRVEWRGKYARVCPPIQEAVTVLKQFAPVLESAPEAIDLGSSGTRPVNADVERQLRRLAAEGRTFDAIVLAARTYEMSQGEARRIVERLAVPSAASIRLDDGSAV